MSSRLAHLSPHLPHLPLTRPPPHPQIMILLCNQQSFICTHIDFCHPRCYQHHSRSCARLVRAIKLVYGETVDSLREDSATTGNIGARAKKNKEVGRLVFAVGGRSLTGDFSFFFFSLSFCSFAVFGQVVPAHAVHEEETHRLQHGGQEGHWHAQVHPQPGDGIFLY